MPIKPSAFKELRKTKKRTLHNKAVKGTVRDAIKAVRKAIEAADYAKAETALKTAIKMLDKASQNNVLKKNTASRKKSRLAHAVAKAKDTKK